MSWYAFKFRFFTTGYCLCLIATVSIAIALFVNVTSVFAYTGNLDRSFGLSGTGIVTTAITPYSDERAYAGTVLPDGRIVAVGYTRPGPDETGHDFAIVCYLPDGTLDENFGLDHSGKIVETLGGNEDILYSVTTLPSGGFAVAGTTWNGVAIHSVVEVYTAKGRLDTDFGPNHDGRVITPFSDNDQLRSITALSDGSLIGVGTVGNSSQYEFLIVRYTPDGKLDTDFGPNHNGWVSTPFDAYATAHTADITSDGKIVVAGNVQTLLGRNLAVARYNSNGELDTTFGPNHDGKLSTSIGTGNDDINSVHVLPDGKILAVGGSSNTDTINQTDFAISRFTVNGEFDQTFGPNKDGKVITAMGTGTNDYLLSSAVLPNGKLLVAGETDDTHTNYDSALALYNSDGTIDTTFGPSGNGIVVSPISSNPNNSDMIWSILPVSGNKVVAVGDTTNDTNHDFAVSRYQLDDRAVDPPNITNSLRIQKSKLSIINRRIKVTRKRKTTVTIACSKGANTKCSGALKLTAKINKKKARSIAKKSFVLAPGKQIKLKLKITKTAFKALKKTKKLKAVATALSKNPALATTSAKAKITLVLARTK